MDFKGTGVKARRSIRSQIAGVQTRKRLLVYGLDLEGRERWID